MIDPVRWSALEDLKFRASLVQQRLVSEMTAMDVAEACNHDLEWSRRMEDFDYDPTLSEVRRYAKAVGAVYQHFVQALPSDQDDESTPPDDSEQSVGTPGEFGETS